jgi:fatty acid desaturase
MLRSETIGFQGSVRAKHQRYKFSLKIRKQLKLLTKLDNWHGLLALLEDYTIILSSILVTCYWSSWFYPFALLMIGSRQRALATLLHESAHGMLARNGFLNWMLGTFLSGYLIFQQMAAYKKSHCFNHHRYLGHPELDPDFKFYLAEGLYESIDRSSFLLKYIVQPLFLLRVPVYLVYLIQHRLFAKDNDRRESLVLLSYWSAIVGFSIWLGFWDELILFWLVPYFTTFQVLGWFIELSEHYPLLGNSTIDLYLSRNRFSPWYEAFFTSMHNENFHLAHHLFPKVPFWNQPKAHEVLINDYNYRLHNELTGGIFLPYNHRPSILLHILEFLKSKVEHGNSKLDVSIDTFEKIFSREQRLEVRQGSQSKNAF